MSQSCKLLLDILNLHPWSEIVMEMLLTGQVTVKQFLAVMKYLNGEIGIDVATCMIPLLLTGA